MTDTPAREQRLEEIRTDMDERLLELSLLLPTEPLPPPSTETISRFVEGLGISREVAAKSMQYVRLTPIAEKAYTHLDVGIRGLLAELARVSAEREAEERKACCGDQCYQCRGGDTPTYNSKFHYWMHGMEVCGAHFIRQRAARALGREGETGDE